MYTCTSLQSMTSENCHVGQLTPLPPSIQQTYNTLQAPQCTNITYMNTFVHRLLIYTGDADIRNIVCHLSDAVSKLHLLHVSTLT